MSGNDRQPAEGDNQLNWCQRFLCCNSLTIRHIIACGTPTALISLFAVVICFFIFVHPVTQLPALSLAGVYPLGRYIMTATLLCFGGLLLLSAVVLCRVQRNTVHVANESRSEPLKCCWCCPLINVHYLSCTALGISAVGLAGLGLFPILEPGLEDEILSMFVTFLHLFHTIMFFIAYFVHMILQTCVSFRCSGAKNPCNWIKVVSLAVCALFVTIVPLIYSLILVWSCDLNDLVTDMMEDGPDSMNTACAAYNAGQRVLGALNQYAVILCIVVYATTYWADFGDAQFECSFPEVRVAVERGRDDGNFVPLEDDSEEESLEEEPDEGSDREVDSEV